MLFTACNNVLSTAVVADCMTSIDSAASYRSF